MNIGQAKAQQLLSTFTDTDLVKGGTYPVGTVRTYSDGHQYIKIATGKWVRKSDYDSAVGTSSEYTLNLSEYKSYNSTSSWWAKKQADKQGKVAVMYMGEYWLLPPNIAKEVNQNGGQTFTEKPKKEKKSKNSTAEWTAHWNKKAPIDGKPEYKQDTEKFAREFLEEVSTMSQKKFEGFITSQHATLALKNYIISDYEGDGIEFFIDVLNDLRSETRFFEKKEWSTPHGDGFSDFSSLTRGELVALRSYTSHSYYAINRTLTGKLSFEPPKETQEFIERIIKTAESGIDNIKNINTPEVVLRGYTSRKGWEQAEKEKQEKLVEALLNKGGEIGFGTITSTSRRRGKLLGADDENSIIYIITPKVSESKCKSVKGISVHYSEEEIIFPPTTKFRVLGVETGDLRKVSLEVEEGDGYNYINARNVIRLQEI